MDEPDWLDRFLSKVEESSEVLSPFVDTFCWLWQGSKKEKDSYGRFGIGTKTYMAHRIMYEYVHGPISPNMVIMHKCDVKSCVNPEHLQMGSQTENMQDCKKKGRSRLGRKGRYLFSDKEADRIRKRYASKRVTMTLLAKVYGVSLSTISSIVNQKD